MLKRFLLYTANALMILLAPPALGILATWNTLPGELLYPIKRGLETAALFVLSPSFQAKSSLHSELISRRTSEATRLLAVKNSTQGLKELQAEIAAARIQFEDPNLDAATKQKAAQQMISKLEATDQALQKVQSSSTPLPRRAVPTYPTYNTNQPTTPQTIYVYQDAPQTQAQTEIHQTQIIIKQTIIQIQQQAQETNQQQDQDDDRDDRGGRGPRGGSDNDNQQPDNDNTPQEPGGSPSQPTDSIPTPDSSQSLPNQGSTNETPDKPTDTTSQP